MYLYIVFIIIWKWKWSTCIYTCHRHIILNNILMSLVELLKMGWVLRFFNVKYKMNVLLYSALNFAGNSLMLRGKCNTFSIPILKWSFSWNTPLLLRTYNTRVNFILFVQRTCWHSSNSSLSSFQFKSKLNSNETVFELIQDWEIHPSSLSP